MTAMSTAEADIRPLQHTAPFFAMSATTEAEAERARATAARRSSRFHPTRATSNLSIQDRQKAQAVGADGLQRLRKRSMFARSVLQQPQGAQAPLDQGTIDYTHSSTAQSLANGLHVNGTQQIKDQASNQYCTALPDENVKPPPSPSRHRKTASSSAIQLMRQQLAARKSSSSQVSSQPIAASTASPQAQGAPALTASDIAEHAPSSWFSRMPRGRRRPSSTLSPHGVGASASGEGRGVIGQSPTSPSAHIGHVKSEHEIQGSPRVTPSDRKFPAMRSPDPRKLLEVAREEVSTSKVASTSSTKPTSEKFAFLHRTRRSSTVGSADQAHDTASKGHVEPASYLLPNANGFRAAQTDTDFYPGRSSDSLASTTTASSTRHRLARRASGLINKATTMPWGRKGRMNSGSAGMSGSSTDNAETSPQGARLELVPSSRSKSSHSRSNLSDTSERPVEDARTSHAPKSSVALGNGPTGKGSDDVSSSAGSSPRIAKFINKRGLGKTATISRAHGQTSEAPSQSLPSHSQTAGKSRSSLLLGLGRGEANTSSGSGGARSGLDRALRYFLDNGDQDEGTGEGIWLLGVWHGPSDSSSAMSVRPEAASKESGESAPSQSVHKSVVQEEAGQRLSSADADDAEMGTSSGKSDAIISVNERPESEYSASLQQDTASQSTRSAVSGASRSDAVPAQQTSRSAIVMVPSVPDKGSEFLSDFSSRIWCTYRSQFTPISRDGTISREAEEAAATLAALQLEQEGIAAEQDAAQLESGHGGLGQSLGIARSPNGYGPPSPSPTTTLSERMGIPNLWNRATAAAQAYGLTGRSGLTTDAGWGCMLRTGQSLLANALLSVHLGRQWRRKSTPLVHDQAFGSSTSASTAPTTAFSMQVHQDEKEQYARYVQLLSWFMDEPSLACPFGVHRMAREGKRLGKEVGEWFGPSTAAGAIHKLVEDYPECGIGVNVASDGVVYLDQVKAEGCRISQSIPSSRKTQRWQRPVLVLIGIRLGLDGVHPMYHDSVKALFAFPHSMGIAGGRPSSSYYFVGYQGNNLFYLDPHHVRPAVHFKHPPEGRKNDADWWVHAYTEQELSTFHNDRPRRMPMKSLDPSMLLGFLIQDEESLRDFVERVRSLPRPIFSVQDSMPRWMMADGTLDLDDEAAAIESISESSVEGEEKGSEAGREAEESPLSSAKQVAAEAQGRRPAGLHRSPTAASSATIISDNAFELVDNEGGTQTASPQQQHNVCAFPSLGPSSSSLRVHEAPTINVVKTGDAIGLGDPSASASAVSAASSMSGEGIPAERPGHTGRDETLSSNYSVVSESDAGEAWEELHQGIGGDEASSDARSKSRRPDSHKDIQDRPSTQARHTDRM